MLQTRSSVAEPSIEHISEPGSSQDILAVLWRWRWVIMLGVIVGAACGGLNYSRQPPTFQSKALVQVVYPSSSAAGLDALETTDSQRSITRLDESRIIKSSKVIDLAITQSELKEHPFFEGKTEKAINAWILTADRLTVEPAGRDNSTALLEIRFTCADKEVSQLIVDAVIAGYDIYLKESHESLGSGLVQDVSNYYEKIRESYEGLTAEYESFQKDAPLIWLGDEARNQFAQNSIEVGASINGLEINRKLIQATLEHVDDAMVKNRPAEAILMMLAADESLGVGAVGKPQEPLETPKSQVEAASNRLPFSSAEKKAELIELQMKEQELLDTVGEGHPTVAGTRRKIELLKRQVELITDAEKSREEQQRLEAEKNGEVELLTPEEKLALWRRSLEERLASLDRQLLSLSVLAEENTQKSKEIQSYLTRNRLLNSELASVQTLLDGITSTLNRIKSLPQDNRRSLQTLTPAEVGSFYGPTMAPYLLGGTAIGFIIVAGIGICFDWFDRSFRSPDEISEALGFSVLGHVPQVDFKLPKGWNRPYDPSLCTLDRSHPIATEAIRSIRTGLYFSEVGGQHRVIQITSPVPGDGKSTIAANLAITIAQSGRSVLLIDADLRRPRVAKLLGSQGREGLGEYIAGVASLDEVVRDVGVRNLQVLAGTNEVANPSELLSHPKFNELLRRAREEYDYVIVDTPPVLAVADASAVAASVDGVVLAIRMRRDARPTAINASRALVNVGANVLGVVVNGVNGRGYEYNYSKYGSSYIDSNELRGISKVTS